MFFFPVNASGGANTWAGGGGVRRREIGVFVWHPGHKPKRLFARVGVYLCVRVNFVFVFVFLARVYSSVYSLAICVANSQNRYVRYTR